MASPTPKIHVVQTRTEFDAVISCQWAGFSGLDKFYDVWFPADKTGYLGRPNRDVDAAIREARDRLWAQHTSEPNSNWIYMQDESKRDGDTPFVTGSCQWTVLKGPGNPFPETTGDLSCPAWKDDEVGTAITRVLGERTFAPRLEGMLRPHVGLAWMAVRPEYRKLGIGRALVRWGEARADEHGLEGFIEASPMGALLYQACGWRQVGATEDSPLPVPRDDPDLARRTTDFLKFWGFDAPFSFPVLWRPPYGRWNEDGRSAREFWVAHRG